MTSEHSARESGEFVQSLARGLSVIRAFDEHKAQKTLTDVAQDTGMTRASARRFLHTLVALGYVATDGKFFWLTARVLTLGYSFLSGLTLPELAEPHLRALANDVRESTSLSVLEGGEIYYISRVSVRQIMRASINVGTRFPAYPTSMGRVLLAGLPAAALDEYLATSHREKFTPVTKTDADDLRREIGLVRRQGWATVADELEPGLCSLAAPVRGRDGTVVAAVNVSLASGVGSRDRLKKLLHPLLATATAISADVALREMADPDSLDPLTSISEETDSGLRLTPLRSGH